MVAQCLSSDFWDYCQVVNQGTSVHVILFSLQMDKYNFPQLTFASSSSSNLVFGSCIYDVSTEFFLIQAGAQEKFMRIKHAYNTLVNSESQRNYGRHSSDFSYSGAEKKQGRSDQNAEEFYGFGNCFWTEL